MTPHAFQLFRFFLLRHCIPPVSPPPQSPEEIELKTIAEQNGVTTTELGREISRKKLPKWDTIRRLLVLLLLVLITLFMACAYSLVGPFLPIEASEKGSSAITTGVIIGASSFSLVTLSPFIGYYLPVLGVRFALVMGTTLVGGAFFLMSFLTDMPSGAVFVVFAILLRLTEGVGWAMAKTAILSLLPSLFPSHLGLLAGLVLGGEGLGFAIGPPIGGLLVYLSNYRTPFLLFGGITLLCAPLPLPLLKLTESPSTEVLPLRTVCKLFTDLMFCLLLLSITVNFYIWAFFVVTLALYLKNQIGLNQLHISLVFVMASSSYVLFSIISGKLADTFGPRKLIIFGIFAESMSLILLGITPLTTKLFSKWTILVPFAIYGSSVSLVSVPVYSDLVRQAKLLNLTTEAQKDALNSTLSGLIAFSASIGEFVGALLGGFLTLLTDFPTATLVVGEAVAAHAFIVLGVTVIDYICKKNKPTTS